MSALKNPSRSLPNSLATTILQLIRKSSAAVVVVSLVLSIVLTRRWPFLGDASLMHYVVFLIGRGMVPYRDIVDVNMPGTYSVEWLVMHLFGWGPLAWRLYDIGVGFLALIAMVIIAQPRDWLAGVFAGSIFMLLHERDGIAELGQRDFLMSMLLLWSTALLMLACRKRKVGLLVLAGGIAGFAVMVKPVTAIFWGAMIGSCLLARSTIPWNKVRFLLGGLCLFPVPSLVFGFWLYRVGALSQFWEIASRLIPYHNGIFRLPIQYFVLHPIPSSLNSLLIPAAIVAGINLRSRWRPSSEEMLLLIGSACGFVSFLLQRKGYSYQRYPEDAFLVLLLSLILFAALKQNSGLKTLKAVAAFGLIAGSVFLAPACLLHICRLGSSPRDFSTLLQQDLKTLGGSSLDGRVQCIDFASGCVTALYRSRIRQATGFLYDCYAYGDSDVARDYRASFGRALFAHPPRLLILSNESCGSADSFNKITQWPELHAFIESHYVLYKQVDPPDPVRWAQRPEASPDYRIYAYRPDKM